MGGAPRRCGPRSATPSRTGPTDQRALVPALVDGDDAGLDPALADDFRTTGLTHLLAVSGTNLTLVVGFLLVLARWGGVRGRWLYVVGAAGIVGFVLLARTEPSVLRAAVMGTVALFAMGTNGRQRGTRALGVAVLALLLVRARARRARPGSRSRCSPPPGSCCWPRLARRAGPLAAALGGRGDRGAGRGPAGLHARSWPRSRAR